ncbi:MAG: ORF6N domain-containing protein [Bacteroidetes bacterium]|nr:ORF6N domain-containing protein [Bacteroidota bacterium]
MQVLTEEKIINKIYVIRGKKVMIDKDLAELYDVETKQLKRSVRRNIERFPDDLRSQIDTSSWGGTRYMPLVFTEQGVAMLSSVLNSDRAIAVNIQIIRVFTKMREMLETHKEILQKIDLLQRKEIEQDEKIMLIFEYIKQLEQSKQQELEQKRRNRIGYKKSDKE